MSKSLSNNLYANKIYGNKLLVDNSQVNKEKLVINYNKNIHTKISINEEKDGHNVVVLQFVDYDLNYHIIYDAKRFINPEITIAKLYITNNENNDTCYLTHTSLRDEQNLNTFGQDGKFKYLVIASDGIFSNYTHMLLNIKNDIGERTITFY